MATTPARNIAAEIAFLTRALKAPSLAGAVERLAERARSEGWSHEEFLAACLQREVAARESHGGEGRIRMARFPARKSLEEFDFDHQRSLKRDVIAHLGTAQVEQAAPVAVLRVGVAAGHPVGEPVGRAGGEHTAGQDEMPAAQLPPIQRADIAATLARSSNLRTRS